MIEQATIYQNLVYLHILLFVFWLGADLGVFILGQHFRKRDYSIPERLTILKLLVITDMGPRTAWCLMVPVSITMTYTGNWWSELPMWAVLASWIVGFFWLWLVWDAHAHDQTPRAARNRRIENWLKSISGLALPP
jgi:uncharacterized membrane protein